MLEYVLGGVAVAGAIGSVTGWIAAYRARGESRDSLAKANESAERARLAEVATEAAKGKTFDAEARAATAIAQCKVAEQTLASTQSELARERREKAKLIDDLAKRGVPIGDVLVDSSVDRLYEDEDRRGSEGRNDPGSGSSDDREGVSGDASDAPHKTRSKR